MTVEHGATVLPFTDALLRAPKNRTSRANPLDHAGAEGPPRDNVIVLARFARRARRSHARFRLSDPPGGEAA